MAFLGNFQRVLEFIRENSAHPLVQNAFVRSEISPSLVTDYETFQFINPLTKQKLSEMHMGGALLPLILAGGYVSKIFTSPGPVYNVKGERWEHYRFYKALEAAGFIDGDVAVNTFSYHGSPAGDMAEEACEKCGCAVYPLGPADSGKGAETILAVDANAFIGTKTYLFKCLEKLEGRGRLEKAFLMAEKLTEDDKAVLFAEHGIKAFQAYGTAEAGLIAYETAGGTGMKADTDALFIEILDADGKPAGEGETGEVVVTFMNGTTPFIRLATGDLSFTENGRLAGVFGRTDSSVKFKGVFVHFWVLEKLCAECRVSGRLDISNTPDGADSMCLSVSGGDTDMIRSSFYKAFGLRLPEIKVDDTISETAVQDTRKQLNRR
ncbi:phenylacetate--CoA ligase family protein [Geovibrio thiophilus]|uniref:Phenylacetate--CoA ligase family protein n=1 Tax=Geovibrio thiophilus TaxID=139438 RepID=A0A3R5YZD2_9BACT|nr:phenylacetate--CoA ligase family protein [Geovibrio thiophilus]QAR33222.1 phenylacetate--CoA ligase family protein [Geovibrio thiophilus]